MKTLDFLDKQRRMTMRLAKIAPIVLCFITAMNIWDDASKGKPFDWTHIAYAVGFLIWMGVVLFFMRLIFNSVRANFLDDRRF